MAWHEPLKHKLETLQHRALPPTALKAPLFVAFVVIYT
jgi:hypothetical protein